MRKGMLAHDRMPTLDAMSDMGAAVYCTCMSMVCYKTPSHDAAKNIGAERPSPRPFCFPSTSAQLLVSATGRTDKHPHSHHPSGRDRGGGGELVPPPAGELVTKIDASTNNPGGNCASE